MVASAGGAAAVGVVGCGGSWWASIPAWLKLNPREKTLLAQPNREIAQAAEKEIGCSGLACAAPREESSAPGGVGLKASMFLDEGPRSGGR